MSCFPLLDRIEQNRDFVAKRMSFYEVDSNGCWNYTGTLNESGYGRFQIKGMKVFAHRVSLAYHKGIEVQGRLVCHSCDNPACINPEHLWLGSFMDNSRDMMTKGRAADQRGASNGNARLTESDVIEIKHLIELGLNNKQIARKVPVSHSMVSRIRLGKSWANVNPAP